MNSLTSLWMSNFIIQYLADTFFETNVINSIEKKQKMVFAHHQSVKQELLLEIKTERLRRMMRLLSRHNEDSLSNTNSQ